MVWHRARAATATETFKNACNNIFANVVHESGMRVWTLMTRNKKNLYLPCNGFGAPIQTDKLFISLCMRYSLEGDICTNRLPVSQPASRR